MSLKRQFRKARRTIGRKIAGDPVKGYYEAARPSPYHRRRGMNESPDGATRGAIEALRAEARHLEQNYDLIAGGLDVFVNAVIGRGLIPRPLIRSVDGDLHDEANLAVVKLLKNWMQKPDVTGEHTYSELQRLMARSWARDGEIFSQRLQGYIPSLDHQTDVPYSIEAIEPDLFPVGFTDERRRIVSSVQKNDWGRPVSFWCYRSYIGDAMAAIARAGAVEPDKVIPASRVTHLKHVTRFRQTRGVSVLASTLDRIDSIKDGEESELVAMRVAAAMTGYIKKGTADMYTAPDPNKPREPRNLAFNPGQIYELEEGEEVGTIQSNRPNNNLIEFQKDQQRRMASGMKVSYSSLSKNYDGTYSAQRQERTEQQVSYGACSRYFADHMVTPDYRGFMSAAIASGALQLPADVDMASILDHDVPLPAMPWIDPAKEAKAWETLVDARLESRQHVMAERGRDPETVWGEIEHEERHHPARVQDQPKPENQNDNNAQ